MNSLICLFAIMLLFSVPGCSYNDDKFDPLPFLFLQGNISGNSREPNTGTEIELNRTHRYLFAATEGHNGSFGGVAGADAYCNAHVPAALTSIPRHSFRAMLSAGTNRKATVNGSIGDGQINWVLRPNQEYRRADEAVVFTTNNNSLYDLMPGSLQNPFSSASAHIWTGLGPDWTDMGDVGTCNNWTTGGSGLFGEIGDATATSVNGIHWVLEECSMTISEWNNNSPIGLLCVEQ